MRRTAAASGFARLLALVGLVFCTADAGGHRSPKGFEVHEWGVLAGCQSGDKYFDTSRPLQVLMVREPVIYIHSRDKRPFSLRVTFKDGKPTDTYPAAEVSGSTASWSRVEFAPPGPKKLRGLAAKDFVPLKEILPVLDDVDADELVCGGQAARFLFYEGQARFDNRVTAVCDLAEKAATLQNSGSSAVHDVTVVVPRQGKGPYTLEVFVGRARALGPGEKVSVSLEKLGSAPSFVPQLIALGFTEREAASFDKLWMGPFFSPTNVPGWCHLIYRLGQDQCAAVSELAFQPKPEKVVRALYVLVRSFDLDPVDERTRQAPAPAPEGASRPPAGPPHRS